MPGVDVLTGARPGGSDLLRAPGSAYFVAGLAERGDTAKAVLVRSMAEFVERFGNRVSYGFLFDDVSTYFAEGGERAYVARVVGPAATVGTRTLADTAAAPTVRLDAASPGAWSAGVEVEVTAGALPNSFRLLVYLAGDLVEQFFELTSPADAVAQVNARSNLLRATNLGSPTAAPGNNPAPLARTALSAGTDDRAAVTVTDYVAALDRFGPELGTGAVAIPGQQATTAGAGLIAHARARRRVALTATTIGSTVANVKTVANGLRAVAGAEHLGLFHPWVIVPDNAGGSRTIPPEGYVAGVRARAHRDAGPWRAPAGEIAISRHVLGVEGVDLTRAQIDDLANSRVNPIRRMGSTVRLYGWRSLSTDETNYKLLTARDTLNNVAMRAEAALEQFVHAPVDGRGLLFGRITGELIAILDPMRAAGGLYEKVDEEGARIDPGYIVDAGPSVNTPEVLANNEVRANVAIRIAPAAELITITVTKVAFDAPLGG